MKKRVKYIHDRNNITGFEKKCDLDVEMAVDLIRFKDDYDYIIIFSGDGDLMYAVEYLVETLKKQCYVFGARDHVGREVMDALNEGVIKQLFFAGDFEYRLNSDRFYRKFRFKR